MTESLTTTTYTADIFIAGDAAQAMQVCREFCLSEGFCVTVCPCEFIYTGGQESGVRVGCINYPRFPSTPEALWGKAVALAQRLRARLCQQSFSVVASDKTVWFSTRENSE